MYGQLGQRCLRRQKSEERRSELVSQGRYRGEHRLRGEEMSLSHIARGAMSAENGRRFMMLRGFTPNGHRLWDRFEAGNLLHGYPDYPAVMSLNVTRTRPAHYGKAGRMGITKPRARPWDPNELFRLHRLYPKAERGDLLAALPTRTWSAICTRARADGYRRPPNPIKPTGNALLDQILERARQIRDGTFNVWHGEAGDGTTGHTFWQCTT